jgi:hypothetical protein
VRRHRCSADMVEALEHPNATPGAGEVGGGYQAVVPAADNDGVVGLAQLR